MHQRQVGEDSFVVTNPKNSSSTTVQYADVMYVKKPFPKWATITIVGGIAAGAFLGWLAATMDD